MKFAPLILFFAASVTAAVPVLVETPETEVEISIFDLVKHKPPAPQLPADYGARVAAAIEAQRALLVDCVRGVEKRVGLAMQLQIDGNGVANAVTPEKELPSAARICVQQILAATKFPNHPLREKVTVKFPLTLEKKNL